MVCSNGLCRILAQAWRDDCSTCWCVHLTLPFFFHSAMWMLWFDWTIYKPYFPFLPHFTSQGDREWILLAMYIGLYVCLFG